MIVRARLGSTSEILKVRSLVLATGVFNTVNLLARSDLFDDRVRLDLEECDFKMGLQFGEQSLLQAPSEVGTRIQFALDRAFAHGFKSIFQRWITFLPNQIAVEQQFGNDITTASWNIEFDKGLGSWAVEPVHSTVFGRSVHYCNLHINGKPVSSFLRELGNFKIIGMAAVNQQSEAQLVELTKVASSWIS